jgi:hypothetical protein
MALKGTLKDFGIADILQLIGQQQKTGMLHLKAREQEIHVGFKDGSIVKAESTTRKKKELIGGMLVRAGLITEQQLAEALEQQRRSLMRLGDTLVGMGAISADRFKEMVNLQTAETVFKLFSWKTGSYAFEATEVDYEEGVVTPLRGESVLMEGFQRVDEWPLIKKRITSYNLAFERHRALPAPTREEPAPDADFDDAFGEGGAKPKGELSQIGASERRVYALADPDRPVSKIIDLSCLGEFETCKALSNLVQLDFLRPTTKGGVGLSEPHPDGPFIARMASAVGRVLVSMVLLAVIGWFASRLDLQDVQLSARSPSTYTDPAAQRFVSRQQIARIEAALGVYRLERGELPEKLELLVETKLLKADDLRYPWRDAYFYRRKESGAFVLLPPLR